MRSRRGRNGTREGLRVVAACEALKGGLVLAAGCGLLTLVHRDLHRAAVQVVRVLHLNPAQHFPTIFIDAAAKVTDLQLWTLALSAFLYAVVRFIEAYGLWKRQAWAEWFGLVSGAIYLPIELYEAIREPTWPRLSVFLVNAALVAYLGRVLYRERGRR